MQLILLLALLAMSGNKNDAILSDLKPMLENFGGEELKSAISEVEKLSGVLSAVQAVAASAPPARKQIESEGSGSDGFPLAPIAAFADRDITYSLSQYISEQN